MDETTGIQQKTATINDGFPNINSQPVENRQNKQSKKLVIISLLIAALLLCGGVFAIYINKVIKNEKPVSLSSIPTQPTTKSTSIIDPTVDWKIYNGKDYPGR